MYLLVLILFQLNIIELLGSSQLCEKLDEDCPSCEQFQGDQNFTAVLNISPFHFKQEYLAYKAENYIRQQGKIQSVDSPLLGLHTTIYYFCCHTHDEKQKIKQALQQMKWNSFDIHYDSFSCNLDHNNQTIYLHALPSNQTRLFDFSHLMEKTIQEAGVPINHPRKTLFHMTLANVDPQYPVDDVVRYFQNSQYQDFGHLQFNHFYIDSEKFQSEN